MLSVSPGHLSSRNSKNARAPYSRSAADGDGAGLGGLLADVGAGGAAVRIHRRPERHRRALVARRAADRPATGLGEGRDR